LDIFPRLPVDLLVGHPLLLIGRYKGDAPAELRIQGNFAGNSRVLKIPVNNSQPQTPGHAPLASIWARRKIANLGSAAAAQPNPALDRQVRDLALEYGLVSRYTAFVAVDAMTRTADVGGNTK
jgi:Ca-activated chloride channel family protein